MYFYFYISLHIDPEQRGTLTRIPNIKQKNGVIGIVLNHDWAEPLTTAPTDVDAAQRANIFKIAWFADPIFFGHYPLEMRNAIGPRLPTFSEEQKKRVMGSWDVFFLNHYTRFSILRAIFYLLI